jgi:predicted RNA polymerase sigma factor
MSIDLAATNDFRSTFTTLLWIMVDYFKTRADLATEAIRLGRLVMELLPDAEVMELLALMLLQESRRTARTSATGDIFLLEDQDRSLWNRSQIAEGIALVQQALSSHQFGSYPLQAAIAAVELLNDPDATKSQKAMTAMLQMKKIDTDALQLAIAG